MTLEDNMPPELFEYIEASKHLEGYQRRIRDGIIEGKPSRLEQLLYDKSVAEEKLANKVKEEVELVLSKYGVSIKGCGCCGSPFLESEYDYSTIAANQNYHGGY